MSDTKPDNRPVLICDGCNIFFRSYVAYPSMSTNGTQVGGVVGFLKTLRAVVDLLHPKMICITWEGGGSARRRAIFPEYKQNRKPTKLNRFYEDDIPDSSENRIEQNLMLISLLRQLPVAQFYIEDAEGDDVVSYLCRYKFHDDNVVIMSSDRDFYQLLDDKKYIYTPDRKVVKAVNVLERFGVSPANFAIAKAVCGDPSDNIPGVDGVGFKRLVKNFPMLAETQEHLLEDVLAFGRANYEASTIIKRVIDNEQIIKRNYRLVVLDSSMLASQQIEKINYSFDTFEPKVNKLKFTEKLVEFGITTNFDIDNYVFAFRAFMFTMKSHNKIDKENS